MAETPLHLAPRPSPSVATGGDADPGSSGAAPLRGILLAVVGACLFSLKPILIKLAYAYPIDATVLMTLRMAFSLPFYIVLAFMAVAERRRRALPISLDAPTLARTALIGIAGYYAASYLDLLGLTMITAQFERLILFTYPTFVLLLGALLLGERISVHTALAVVLSYLGLALIFAQDLRTFGHDVTLGAACVLGASLTYSGYLLLSQFEIRKLGSRLFTCLAMIAASLAILVHFAASHATSALVDLPLPVYGLTLMIAVVATVIPSLLVAAAIEAIGPGLTSTLSGLGPVFTTGLGISLLGEPFTLWHLAGMALVIAGALLLAQNST